MKNKDVICIEKIVQQIAKINFSFKMNHYQHSI